jgi:two-component system sensor histidine kinase MprB
VTSWIHRRSFQGRLTTLVAVAVGVAIALSAACSYLIVRNQLYGQVDQHLKSYLSKSANGPRLNVQQAANVALQAGYTVEAFPTVGAPSNLSGEPGALTLTPTSGLRALADAPRGTVALGTIHQGGRSYRTVATPVEVVNGAVAQRGTLLIAEWLGPTLKTLATLRLILYLVGLAGIALAIVFGLAISRLTLRPVKRLTGAAEHTSPPPRSSTPPSRSRVTTSSGGWRTPSTRCCTPSRRHDDSRPSSSPTPATSCGRR